MKPDVLFFLLWLASTVTAVGFAVAWARASQAHKRLKDRVWGMAAGQHNAAAALSDDPPISLSAQNPRIDQLESQIDTISQQLDRLAESQDFLSRVLTERIDQLPEPRLRTPH